MRLICWAGTDVGRKRERNEDSYLLKQELGLFAVADGMGGHAGGARASRMAVQILDEELRRHPEAFVASCGLSPEDDPPPARALRIATRAAGARIFDAAQKSPGLSGMGTTLTSLLFTAGRVYLSHVGDSRAYLLRDGRLTQLSEDHSFVGEQLRAGFLTPEKARTSQLRHIITRSVGYERDVKVDTRMIPAMVGDCFLICSDGLLNHVEDVEIAQVLSSSYYRHAPKRLIELANERGGDDNITLLVVYVANEAQPAPKKSKRRSRNAESKDKTPTAPAL